jgi:sugar phosphate isomerase/epimerase
VPLSVSNIAWSPAEDAAAFALLRESGIGHLEVAPGRIWPNAGDTLPEQAASPIAALRTEELSISGFQAILFGKPDLRLFDETSRDTLLAYLKRLANLCAAAGGTYLVFGAPKNRWLPDEVDRESAWETAVTFLRELGNFAASKGVIFGIEANPAAYGCNFCTHVGDVAALVGEVASPGIGWHLDTGELAMNHEKLPDVIAENAGLICSAHVSEPGLGDFTTPWPGHPAVAHALRSAGYSGFVSLEMKRPENGLDGVRTAIDFLRAIYT